MLYNRAMSSSSSGDSGAGRAVDPDGVPDRGAAPPVSARRIVVVGCTGSGKTTLARSLAGLLGVPHVELDALNWEPNWTAAQTDVFRQRVRDALTGDAWVVEGNYRVVRDLVWPRAELLVWLDPPYRVAAWRLLRRTLRRVFRRETLWNGNREVFVTQFLSGDSLFIYQVRAFGRVRKEIPEAIGQPEHAHLNVVSLRSAGAVREWLADFRETARRA